MQMLTGTGHGDVEQPALFFDMRRGTCGHVTWDATVDRVEHVHPNQITDWNNQLLERAAGVFGAEASSEPKIDLKESV